MVVKRRSHWCKAIDVRLTVGMCLALGSESFLKRPVRGKVEIYQVSCSQLISRICWVSEYGDQGHVIGHHGFDVSMAMGNHLPSRQMMLDLESMGDWEVKKSRRSERPDLGSTETLPVDDGCINTACTVGFKSQFMVYTLSPWTSGSRHGGNDTGIHRF